MLTVEIELGGWIGELLRESQFKQSGDGWCEGLAWLTSGRDEVVVNKRHSYDIEHRNEQWRPMVGPNESVP